jgi:PAT family beta-lactamase induction signal transducer AmpG
VVDRGLNPSTALASVAGFAVLVGLFGATQDIVIDAWRIEAADDSRQGAMAAAYQWGYRIAVIVAGAVPLLLAEAYSWNVSYAVMAALMGIGVAGVLLAPRERQARCAANPCGRHAQQTRPGHAGMGAPLGADRRSRPDRRHRPDRRA